MTPLELVQYYVKLLIMQYKGKPKAEGTIQTQIGPVVIPQTSVQTLTLSGVPSSGAVVFKYGSQSVPSINWNDNNATIQTKIRTIIGLESVVVTGSLLSGPLVVTFDGLIAPADLLTVFTNTLGPATTIMVEDDSPETLPLAVQDGFNLISPNLAAGLQLDVIGKYVGAFRSGPGFTGQITLDDTDYFSLIRMAIIQNSASSSLAEIQDLLHTFFPGQMLVFDYQNMQMNYLISSAVGSPDLIQLFITEGLLPKPMAVGVAVIIYAPIIDMFFGFRTYSLPAYNSTPFNSYADYQTDWPWLSYQNAVII